MSDSNYLMHYKYISRKWKNGRWVYTYPGGSTHTVGRTIDALGYNKKAEAIDKLIDAQVAYSKHKSINLPEYEDAYKRSSQAATYARSDAKIALDEYYETPVGKLDKLDDKIDVGRNFVANLLQKKLPKAASKIRPKEEHINWANTIR